MSTLKLTFEFQGRARTLNKHPRIQTALNTRCISEEDARKEPWILRRETSGTTRYFTLDADNDKAIAGAKNLLKGEQQKPTEFHAFLAERDAKRSVTFRQLADEWFKLNMPDNAMRPRDEAARGLLKPILENALNYWGSKAAQTATKAMMLDYAAHCRRECQKLGRGTGERKTDKALSALSCLSDWAAATGKIPANPFLKRPRIQDAADIQHCHEFTTDSDEQWHQVLSWFFTHPTDELHLRVAGAWLAFCGLVGLRREEPAHLFRYPRLSEAPPKPSKLAPGTIFITRDGKTMMKVFRVKHGQNPYVTLHPAALDFLNTWEAWLDQHLPGRELARPWFPNPSEPIRALCTSNFRILNRRLSEAATSLKLDELHTHGFGRAFYVRVRRSQGADDSVIAGELGQTTNGKLIRDTYGDPDDLRGSALFDWLPETGQPAWQLLTAQTETSKIIAPAFA